MLKSKLTWKGAALYIGTCRFGEYVEYEYDGMYMYAIRSENRSMRPMLKTKHEAIELLKKWAHEFFESVIDGATNEA